MQRTQHCLYSIVEDLHFFRTFYVGNQHVHISFQLNDTIPAVIDQVCQKEIEAPCSVGVKQYLKEELQIEVINKENTIEHCIQRSLGDKSESSDHVKCDCHIRLFDDLFLMKRLRFGSWYQDAFFSFDNKDQRLRTAKQVAQSFKDAGMEDDLEAFATISEQIERTMQEDYHKKMEQCCLEAADPFSSNEKQEHLVQGNSFRNLSLANTSADSLANSNVSVKYFVLLSTQRAGSNWVSSRLHTHPEVCMLGENRDLIALEKRAAEDGQQPAFDEIYSAYENGWKMPFDCMYGPKASNSHHVGTFLKKDPFDIKLVGMLVKYSHLEPYLWKWAEKLKSSGVAVLHLVRANTLRSHLSWQTHQLGPVAKQPGYKVDIDVSSLKSHMKLLADVLERVRSSVQLQAVPYHEISYEALLHMSRKLQVTGEGREKFDFMTSDWNNLLAFLGIEIKPLGDPPLSGRDGNKSQRPCREQISNWEEVAAAAANTASLRLCLAEEGEGGGEGAGGEGGGAGAEGKRADAAAPGWAQFRAQLHLWEDPRCSSPRHRGRRVPKEHQEAGEELLDSISVLQWQLFEKYFQNPLVIDGSVLEISRSDQTDLFSGFFTECLAWSNGTIKFDQTLPGQASLLSMDAGLQLSVQLAGALLAGPAAAAAAAGGGPPPSPRGWSLVAVRGLAAQDAVAVLATALRPPAAATATVCVRALLVDDFQAYQALGNILSKLGFVLRGSIQSCSGSTTGKEGALKLYLLYNKHYYRDCQQALDSQECDAHNNYPKECFGQGNALNKSEDIIITTDEVRHY